MTLQHKKLKLQSLLFLYQKQCNNKNKWLSYELKDIDLLEGLYFYSSPFVFIF